MTAKITAEELDNLTSSAEESKKKIEELRQKMEEFKTLYLHSEQRANQAAAQIKLYEEREKNRKAAERFKAELRTEDTEDTEDEIEATFTERNKTLPEPSAPTWSTLRRDLATIATADEGLSLPAYRYPVDTTAGYGREISLPAMTVPTMAANRGAPGISSLAPMTTMTASTTLMSTMAGYGLTSTMTAPMMAANGAPGTLSTLTTVPMPAPATQAHVNFTGGIKLQNYKSGNDIEVFLARYDVYCESVNMPEIKKVSCLLNALDETTFRIVSKELPHATRYTIQQIKDYMLQRFQPPQSEGQLRLMFRNCKQEKDQDLQTFYTDLLTRGTKAFANDNIMSMEKNLMDQFIVGLSEEKVRLHLIERRQTLRSVKEALDCAVAYKEALTYNKNLSDIKTETKDVNTEIAAISRGRGRGRNSYRGANGRGNRRGRDSYTRQRQYGNSRDTEGKPKCFNCGKYGHMARSCINKYNDYRTYDRRSVSREKSTSRERSQSTSPMRNRRSGTPYYNGKSTERDSDRENTTQVRSPIEKRTTIKKTTAVINETGKKNGNPLFLAGKIENKYTNLFIDCGSGISLISDVFYRQISNKKLQRSSAKLQTA